MKYVIVLVVVGVAVWLFASRTRVGGRQGERGPRVPPKPSHMAQCAQCGVHLPASEALIEGTNVYCSEDHRRLGPGKKP